MVMMMHYVAHITPPPRRGNSHKGHWFTFVLPLSRTLGFRFFSSCLSFWLLDANEWGVSRLKACLCTVLGHDRHRNPWNVQRVFDLSLKMSVKGLMFDHLIVRLFWPELCLVQPDTRGYPPKAGAQQPPTSRWMSAFLASAARFYASVVDRDGQVLTLARCLDSYLNCVIFKIISTGTHGFFVEKTLEPALWSRSARFHLLLSTFKPKPSAR